ncbi:hypothetical protein PIB30_065603, partial [Stylosanthes scabra]|nr:hypothetical protein [Stylosanthes scabra]
MLRMMYGKTCIWYVFFSHMLLLYYNGHCGIELKIFIYILQKGRFYRQFKKNGFEYNYDILGEIFNNSTATEKLSHASTKEPPTSDEEKQLEEDFLSKGVHVDSQFVDVDGDDSEEGSRRKKTIRSSSERRRKEAKNARLDKFESALEKWAESVSARTEVSKAKAEKYKSLASQATSSCTDPYSIEACMGLLNSLDNVSKTMYKKAVA